MEKDSNLLTNRKVNGMLAKITDLILVNILFLLTCIPVVTIADATAAMYHMMYHLHEGKDDRTISEYFSFFAKNFVKSLPVEIALAIVAAIQAAAYSAVKDGYGNSVLSVLFLIDVAVISVYSWLVVLFARYENPFAKHLDNAWRLALAELPITLLCVVLRVLPLILVGAAGGSLSGSTLFWFVIGFALIAYVCSGWYLRIFAKRIPSEQ